MQQLGLEENLVFRMHSLQLHLESNRIVDPNGKRVLDSSYTAGQFALRPGYYGGCMCWYTGLLQAFCLCLKV